MGRQITCTIDGEETEFVYQYKFGIQDSEMYRIASVLRIGSWSPIDDHYDQLSLQRNDILLLQGYLDNDQFFIPWLSWFPRAKSELFVTMISAIIAFMERNQDISTFNFVGEL